ncbi:fibro-slime domain-containing protein [Inmirania thermothiophila]|uniref:Fibro-slime domain-containing protein n=1 Tax=Inmirania thermothiophila TaxID=1750597 RepID=A0A3N1Y2Y3_9GAMM|nr:fibro-slime domain-containing protein [Inmirania thermothiophila]
MRLLADGRTGRALGLAVLMLGSGAAGAVTLTGTIRDFCAPDIPGTCTRLADFEGAITGVVTGMVSPTLNAAGLPDYVGGGAGATNAANFARWYTDAPGFNTPIPYALTLTETAPGSGVFSFASSAFFPVDGMGFGNQGRSHNYHFTLHLEGQTSFRAADSFTFTGDDDLWIYVGGRLAIDLGGVHGAASKTITGADLLALGLEEDTLYDLDVFFAERHTVASNFNITTSFRIAPPSSVPEPVGRAPRSGAQAEGVDRAPDPLVQGASGLHEGVRVRKQGAPAAGGGVGGGEARG